MEEHLPPRSPLALLVLCAVCASCGGGGEGGGPALELVSFNFDNTDSVALNDTLEFRFNVAVAPESVYVVSGTGIRLGTGAIQIREGPYFGQSVEGEFDVDGSVVRFKPKLPGAHVDFGVASSCALGDGGFKPDTRYRITILGRPEEQVLESTAGRIPAHTTSHEFGTRAETDPDLYRDQRPGQDPRVLWTTPDNATSLVPVGSAIKVGGGASVRYVGAADCIDLHLSETIDPCSIDQATVDVYVHEQGDPADGFTPDDGAPGDPFSWGTPGSTSFSPPLRIPARLVLVQTEDFVRLRILPLAGRFPDNALIVVQVGNGITDFGGNALVPHTLSFTTTNRRAPRGVLRFEFDETTPVDPVGRTASVHVPRSPGEARGFINVGGDGDNGNELTTPAFPAVFSPGDCSYRPNDGPDNFMPSVDTLFDSGAEPNTCPNDVDGSTAVVWEFATFTIRSGVTVRITGVNPVIIRVTGPVLIEDGGTLLLRGAPGEDGKSSNSARGLPFPKGAKGGLGVAGGGAGGRSQDIADTHPRADAQYYGEDGSVGFGSPDHPGDVEGGRGAGEGNSASGFTGPFPTSGASSGAGGGGGHATTGEAGGVISSTNNGWLAQAPRGAGGVPYPVGAGAELLLWPSTGSGGGAAGYCDCVATPQGHHPGCTASGGAGGGGGGFVDITSHAGITIKGTIDARGGDGGYGGISFYVDIGDTGGGGGGSGGGIRLLTPGNIDVTGALLTTRGGAGGRGAVSLLYGGALPNHGGQGSTGRIVLEDGDGQITGQQSATVIPAEGQPGFYRAPFRSDRIRSASGVTSVRTHPIFVGPLAALALDTPGSLQVVGGLPTVASGGLGATGVLIEIQGYPLLPGGARDPENGSGWWTLGFLRDSGDPLNPEFVANQNPADVDIPEGNQGAGTSALGSAGYVQLRLTFFMRGDVAFDVGGPFLARFDLPFTYEDL